MSRFLFYEEIQTNPQNTAKNQGQAPFEVSIKAYWSGPSINPKYRPGSNEPKKIRKRLLNVQFFNVPANLVDDLVNELGSNPDKEYPSNDRKTYNLVFNCKDLESKTEKAAIKARQAMEFFKQYGYKIPDIQTLMRNIPEEGEFEKIEQNANEKWLDILQELGDGKTNELLNRFIQMYSSIYQYVYGHKLSIKNAKLILSQKPDATLVLTERDWLKFFNCTVNPGAQKIYYEGRYSNRKEIEDNYDVLKQNASSRGINFEKGGDFEGHAQLGIAIDTAVDTKTCFVIGYDTSDVTPNDPNNDWRETKYGMKDNLTGMPNEKTADYLSTLQPKEEYAEQYKALKELMNDNAKLFFTIFVSNLMKKNPEKAKQYASLGNAENNPDYSILLPKVVRRLVDEMLEEEYKVKKPSDRAASRERITGEVLLLCGVWDATALTAIKGGKVDRQTLIHDSNIINKLMDMLETGKTKVLDKLKTAVGQIQLPDENKEKVNEQVLNEKIWCTPAKLMKDFDLEVTGNPKDMTDDEFQMRNTDNQVEMNSLMERMNKASKHF